MNYSLSPIEALMILSASLVIMLAWRAGIIHEWLRYIDNCLSGMD